jgi:hypothetical protein
VNERRENKWEESVLRERRGREESKKEGGTI